MTKKTTSESMPLRVLNTCLWLIDVLQSYKRITRERLNELWREHNTYLNKAGNYDLEARTLRNYWRYLNEMFNIVVTCDRKTNEYYIDEQYDSKVTDWLLSNFALSKMLGECQTIHDRILLEDIPSGRKFLAPLLSAMKEFHPVTITYQKFYQQASETVTGHPLCLKLVHQRWYVLTRVLGHDHYGMYALDRIQDLLVLEDQTFQLPEGFKAADCFEYSYGAFTTSRGEEVQIRVDDFERKYWRTLPIHHSQVETCIQPDYSVFLFQLQITPDFENYLLSMGSHIRVLSPRTLADSIRDMHLQAAGLYQ